MNRLKTITGFKRKTIAVVALWFFLATQPLMAAGAGLGAVVTGCPCTAGNYPAVVFNICNNTANNYQVTGVSFQTPSTKIPVGNIYNSAPVTVTGTGPYSYIVDMPSTSQVFAVGHCDSSDITASYPNTGTDGTPYNVQVLVKTGSCGQPAAPLTPTPIPYTSCANLDSTLSTMTSQPSYYSTTCVPWSYNGGVDAGDFVNTFYNQGTLTPITQIQIGYSSTPININGTCTFDPTSMGGPMYMMAVAGGQEYFNMDMINLLGIGAKENACALQGGDYFMGNASNECPAVGVGGAFNVEEYTFISRMQGFPNLFPQYGPCVIGYPDTTTAIAGCPSIGPGGQTALYFYTHTAGFMSTSCLSSDSAQMVNSVVVAASDLWFIYDLLGQGNSFCFREQLEQGHDPDAAIKIIDGGYNTGLYPLHVAGILPPTAGTLASTNLAPPVAAYAGPIMNFVNQVRADSSCNGSPIYDGPISWAEVVKYYFGNGGSAATQGDGGLLLHFTLSGAQRTALYNDLQCAFNQLSPHWAPYAANGGTPYVSYRYDWLTMMRVAKNYLTINMPIPTSTEFNALVTNYTVASPGCPGLSTETSYPAMTITQPGTGMALNSAVTVCPPFTLAMTATDSVAVTQAAWTFDSTWNTWNNFSGSGPGYSTSITSSTPGMPASGAVTLWVKAMNPCYNNTTQQVVLFVQCTVSTPTPTNSNTPTPTKTNTPTYTLTSTYTSTPTNTYTKTLTNTFTPTLTNTYTSTPSNTATKTFTSTFSNTFTNTFTPTSTATLANTATATYTPSATFTATPTYTRTQTFTSTTTYTPTYTATATRTNTASATSTPSSTFTLTPTVTLTPTGTVPPTSTYTNSPTNTNTFSPTMTPTFTNTPVNTYTPTNSFTPTATQTFTDTAVNTYTATNSFTPTATFTATDTAINTYTVTNTFTPTATLIFTATNTNTFTPTASFTFTNTPINTYTVTNTPTFTYTAVPGNTTTFTFTQTPSFTATSTYSATFTPTATTTFTKTRTPTASATPTNTGAPYDGFYISKNVFTQDQPVSIFVSTTQSPGYYGLTIFNSAGEHIKTLDHLNLTAPFKQSYIWDGRNKFGSICASGVYVVYLTLPFKTVRARVLFIH